ncbi:MAG: hypothetical protein P8N02_10005 [Actinomycetota bacterium]|nr:hypothetical protein [Actinomycetota bacterium]
MTDGGSASHWHDDRARELTGADPNRGSEIGGYLEALWEDFADNVPGVRAQHNTPAGREFRQVRLAEWRSNVGASLAPRIGHLDEGRQSDVVDMMIALSSSSMFLELVDRMGHSPAHAVRLSTEIMGALMARIDAPSQTRTPEDRK